jgi:uncharacterized protein YcbK (DUF882 family)
VAPSLTPSTPFNTKVTPNFAYGELTKYSESRRFLHQYQCDTAIELLVFLERVRAEFRGKPVTITSGHRPPGINEKVGGVANSEHLYNGVSVGAIDFEIPGVNMYTVQDWCLKNWPYSVGKGVASGGYVHLGIRADRKKYQWNY